MPGRPTSQAEKDSKADAEPEHPPGGRPESAATATVATTATFLVRLAPREGNGCTLRRPAARRRGVRPAPTGDRAPRPGNATMGPAPETRTRTCRRTRQRQRGCVLTRELLLLACGHACQAGRPGHQVTEGSLDGEECVSCDWKARSREELPLDATLMNIFPGTAHLGSGLTLEILSMSLSPVGAGLIYCQIDLEAGASLHVNMQRRLLLWSLFGADQSQGCSGDFTLTRPLGIVSADLVT